MRARGELEELGVMVFRLFLFICWQPVFVSGQKSVEFSFIGVPKFISEK